MRSGVQSVILLAIAVILSGSQQIGAASDSLNHPAKDRGWEQPANRYESDGSQIRWHVISSGGTEGGSNMYQLKGTAGQTSTGEGSSTNYALVHGYWQEFGSGYVCGDADASGFVDIDDAVYVITYIFAGGPEPEPPAAGDANCSGFVDIDDVVYLIGYIFSGGNPPCDTDGDGQPNC
jgi:hypothetical protein